MYRGLDSVHGTRWLGKHPDLFERNILVEFTSCPICPILFLLARMARKPVNLQAQPFRVFCAFLPTDMERNLEKQVEEMYVQVMTTLLLR